MAGSNYAVEKPATVLKKNLNDRLLRLHYTGVTDRSVNAASSSLRENSHKFQYDGLPPVNLPDGIQEIPGIRNRLSIGGNNNIAVAVGVAPDQMGLVRKAAGRNRRDIRTTFDIQNTCDLAGLWRFGCS